MAQDMDMAKSGQSLRTAHSMVGDSYEYGNEPKTKHHHKIQLWDLLQNNPFKSLELNPQRVGQYSHCIHVCVLRCLLSSPLWQTNHT